jgi:hypothetical protein
VYHLALVVLLGAIIFGLVVPMMRGNSGRNSFTVSP